MKQRIYIDTSVIGGYFDEEFEADTIKMFDRIRNKDFDVYFSEISSGELILAPQKVKELFNEIPIDCLFELEFTEEIMDLANNYIEENILTEKSLNDAYHIAHATVNRIDILVSWNFRHIVNLNKIRLFNAVNLKLGYPVIDIRSPKELLIYER
jgi:predicted nucleic acid-binding protein